MRSRIAAMILLSFMLVIIYTSAAISYLSPSFHITPSLLFISSFFNLAFLGGGGVLAAYLWHGSLREALYLIGFTGKGVKKSIGYGIISSLSFLILLSIFVSLIGYKENNALAEEIASSINLPLLFIIPLFSSLSEEIFFRGLIFLHLDKKLGFIPAILIASLLFSLAHLEYKALIEIVSTFLFSILLCYLIKITQNIYSPITAHFLYNFISLLAAMLS